MKKLFLIFLLAIILRFLYFPNNIYFGFDQARDAFASQDIIKGDIRLVGPSTSAPGLFHGPLYYYLFVPVYKLSAGSPLGIAAVLRVVNALGVFIVFYIAYLMFGKKTAYVSSFLYAISFEQTQFAIYINHPSLGVISVLIFYLGLAKLIFQKNSNGWLVLALGLGLSLQFEFVLIILLPILFVFLGLFVKRIPKPTMAQMLVSLGIILGLISSFIIAELKFGQGSLPLILNMANSQSAISPFINFWSVLARSFQDNVIWVSSSVALILWVMLIVWLFNKKKITQLIFIILWTLGGVLPYVHNTNTLPLYYHAMGASVGLLVVVAYFLSTRIFLIPLLIISNFYLIAKYNPQGSLPSFNVQSGMLLKHELQVIDYIYKQADGELFSINALTMPLYVNTTWSYLFSLRTSRLPIWGGKLASGYPGEKSFLVNSTRSSLPNLQFLIIEPTRGIDKKIIDDFVREENYFSQVIKEQNFGQFVVQTRAKIK